MKILFNCLFAFVLTFFSYSALNASHIYGAGMTYECVNSCTVAVSLRIYRDCTGSAVFVNQQPTWTGLTPGCTPPPNITGFILPSTIEVTPICPNAQSTCQNAAASIHGVEEHTWVQQFDVCAGSPCEYRLTWLDCCRNPSITSLAMPSSQSIYVQKSTINTALAICNNSPVYEKTYPFYISAGSDQHINMGAYDPDGDSLVYLLDTCFGQNGVPLTYNSGYSPTAPLGSSWNVSLDAETGVLHLLATPGNVSVGVFCTLVKEYRNGVLIASHQRDLMVTAINNPNNVLPTFSPIANLTNGTVNGNEIFLCSPAPICFDLGTQDANASQILTLAWDGALAGATFSELGNPSVTDTIVGSASTPPIGQFCWTPPANGDYVVVFHVEDNACPLLGSNDLAVKIHVGTAFAVTATATPTTCPSANFVANACGSGPFTYQWSGTGGLAGTTSSLTHNYASPGTYAWQVIVGNGTAADTVNGNITIGGTPSSASLLSGIYFVAPCAGNVYDTLIGPSGYSNYSWSNGLSTQNQIVSIGGIYGLTVTDASGCTFKDSTELYWASPDIYGYVSTSGNQALQNQKIYLIEHDTILQALNAIDSVWTDSSGYYFFCNVVDTNVFIKAAPSILDYPNEMPTYADTTLFWNNAIAFHPLSMSPFQHNFSTLFGVNPGGPGFIGGLISQGANKTNGIGDPMPNISVFLRDRNSGNYLGNQITNAAGYFSFGNLPLGDYDVVVDVPNVNTINVPQLTLDNQHQSLDSLDFRLHSTYLELVNSAVGIMDEGKGFEFFVTTNPFENFTQLNFNLESNAEFNLQLLDVAGRQIAILQNGFLQAGTYKYTIGSNLASGIYFARLEIGGKAQVIKLMKLD